MATTYVYNPIGLLSSVTMPGSEVTQLTSYDNEGHLLQRVDGNNVTTNYVYNDPESLLTDIQYPASSSLNVHFTYDSYGRRSGMTDGTGSHSYTYGNLNEVLSVTTTYTGLYAKTISYSYYPDGGRESMTTPAGTFDYSYDSAGRPTSMTNPFSETTTWSYLDNDWLETQTLANGATATYSYNSLGQVTRLLNEISSTTISDFSSISYDGVSNRIYVVASIPGAISLSGTTSYTYDNKDQLIQETSTRNGGFTDSFSYDAAGNSTSFKGVSKTFNANNQQTGSGYVYDGDGNPTTYNGTTLSFDPENRMTAYGNILTARYDGAGNRGWKQNTSSRTYFLYDGTVPIIELDATGSVISTNSFGIAGLTSRYENSSVFYNFDSEGNVSERSDSSGNVLTNAAFAAHGENLSTALSDPFGFKAITGYYTDLETTVQLLTRRYYDPASGRFLTSDPIGYVGGINLYAHVANNPVTFSDAMGEQRPDRDRPGDFYPGMREPYKPGTPSFHEFWDVAAPDYVSFNFSAGINPFYRYAGPGFQFLLTKDGEVFFGPGGGASFPAGFAWSMTAGRINGYVDSAQRHDFCIGRSYFVGGGYGIGGGVTYSPNPAVNRPLTATEMGYFSPQIGVAGAHDFQIH